MTFSDLQALLAVTAGTLRVDARQLLSIDVSAVFDDFLPGGVLELRNASSAAATFRVADQDVDAVHVSGTLISPFLGITGVTVDGSFYLLNDTPQALLTLTGFPNPWRVSVSFPATLSSEADRALFYGPVFTLDTTRPNPIGSELEGYFSADANTGSPTAPPASKRGLSLAAQLDLGVLDATLAQFLQLPASRLNVKGPVEVLSDHPRMQLTSVDHTGKFTFQDLEVDLHYQFLSTAIAGTDSTLVQHTRERLTATLIFSANSETLTIPLAATFEPDGLTETVTVESDFAGAGADHKSPLSLDTLRKLVPVDLPEFPDKLQALDKLAITDLRCDINAEELSLAAFHVRVEFESDPWTIVKDVVTFGDLRFDFTLTHFGGAWQLRPYILGNLTLAGGTLTGVFDMVGQSFFCMLDDDSVVDLKQLFEEILNLGEVFPQQDQFDLTRFEIRGDFGAQTYGFDIATSINMPVDLGATSLSLRNLFASFDYEGGTPSGVLGGSLAIAGVTASMSAAYDPAGWTFELAAYNLKLTDLLATVLGDAKLAEQLPEVTFPVIDLTFSPSTKAFSLEAVADISWSQPFGADAEFDCKIALSVERAAAAAAGASSGTAQAATAPVVCRIAIDGEGSTRVNQHELKATINVRATNAGGSDGKSLDVTAGGSLGVSLDQGDLSFALTFHTDPNSKRISARWPATQGGNNLTLDFKALAPKLGLDLDGVPDELIPTLTELDFDYDFAASRLILGAETEHTKLVFLTGPVTAPVQGSPGVRVYAFLLDATLPVTLSNLPMVGQKLASFADMGVEGLRVSVTSQPLLTADIATFNNLITSDDTTLPTLPPPADPAQPLAKGGVIALRVRTGQSTKSELMFRTGGTSTNGSSGATGTGSGTSVPAKSSGSPSSGVPENVPGVSWLNVQRSFGPVSIRRIGASYKNGDVALLLDAGFALSVVSLDLMGLTLGFPIREFRADKIYADLRGMSLTYSSGPLTISGGFLEVTPGPDLKFEYNGQARITASTFGLSAIGSFAEFTDGKPSLFLFAALNAPLGGPPFFFVTGIAAGFGYNRSLTLPPLSALPSFPLVAAAMPTASHPDPFQGQASKDPTAALTVMDRYVAPAYGENWAAAGIKFTSFRLLESFALLTVSFGTRFEIALLGLTALTVPTGAPEPVGFAELALRVVFAPDEGVLQVAAELTPESYILSRSCHLTGGFAFYLWFKDQPTGAKAGEFVVTLGGYNPHYNAPRWFPTEPRIGANWQVSSALSVKGGLYFALTPSMVMAGGYIQANYQSGNLRAWFDMEADFLLSWKPFHYEAWMGVHIGASYRAGSGITSFTIQVHVGADLHLWGPRFAGTATVDLYVCSVTIKFGAQTKPSVPLLSWQEFRQSFLPPILSAPKAQNSAAHHTQIRARAMARTASSSAQAIPTDTYCLLRITGGLLKDLTKEKKVETDIDFVVNPEKFSVSTSTVIPSTSAVLVTGDGTTQQNLSFGAADFGVGPAGINNKTLQSVHIVRFHKVDAAGNIVPDFEAPSTWLQPVHTELPRAAWFKDPATDATQVPGATQMNGPRTVSGALTGTSVQPPVPQPDETGSIDIARLASSDEAQNHFPKPFFAPVVAPTSDNFDSGNAWQMVATVNAAQTPRASIVAALRRRAIPVRDVGEIHTDYLSRAAKLADAAVKAGDDVPAPVLSHLGEMKAS